MKSIVDELTGYRLKVERDGREIVNIPGILCIPGLLAAPKMGIIGLVAAPLLGCSVHLENADGREVDVGKKVQEAAETIVDTAKTTARTIREEIDKAWESVSADDPREGTEENPVSEENPEADDKSAEDEGSGQDTAEEPEKADEVPVIRVNPDDSDKA